MKNNKSRFKNGLKSKLSYNYFLQSLHRISFVLVCSLIFVACGSSSSTDPNPVVPDPNPVVPDPNPVVPDPNPVVPDPDNPTSEPRGLRIEDAVIKEGEPKSFNIFYTAATTDVERIVIEYETTIDTGGIRPAASSDFTSKVSTADIDFRRANSASVTITVSDDDILELDETFIVLLKSTTIYRILENGEETEDSNASIPIVKARAIITIQDDDTADLIFSPSSRRIAEGENAAFDVMISKQTEFDLVVNYTLSTSDYAKTSDYQTSGRFMIARGSTTTGINVMAIDDKITEADEQFHFVLESVADTTAITFRHASFTIASSDAANIRITAPDDILEGEAGIFTVNTSNGINTETPLLVTYRVSSTEARANDFEGGAYPSGQVMILAETKSATFNIATTPNEVISFGKAFRVDFSTTSDYIIQITPSVTTTDILSDDTAIFVLNRGQEVITEGSGATYTIASDKETETPLSLSWEVRGVASNSATAGDFTRDTFPSGIVTVESGREATFDITTAENNVLIDDKNFEIHFSKTNDLNDLIESVPETASITIENDDFEGVSIFAEAGGNIVENISTTFFTITIREAPASDIIVTYRAISGTASGDDYLLPTREVTLTPSKLSEIVLLPITNDNIVEQDETFTIELTDISPPVSGSTQTSDTITIIDNDEAEISFASATSSISEANTDVQTGIVSSNPISLPITLQVTDSRPSGVVANNLATAGTDYTIGGGTLPSNTINADVNFLTFTNDDILELDEQLQINLVAIDSVFANRVRLATAQTTHIVTIDDDDTADIYFVEASGNITETAGVYSTTIASTKMIEPAISFTTSDVVGANELEATDYTISSSSFSLATNTSASFSFLNVINDNIVEKEEQIKFSFNSAFVSSFNGRLTTPTTNGRHSEHIIKIQDEDRAVISFSDAGDSISESDFTVEVSIATDKLIEQSIAINISTSDSTAVLDSIDVSDYSFLASTLRLSGGERSMTQNLITIKEDVIAEVEEQLRFTLALSAAITRDYGGRISIDNSANSYLLRVMDDDTATITLSPTELSIDEVGANTSGDITISITQAEIPISFTLTAIPIGDNPANANDYRIPKTDFTLPVGEDSTSARITAQNDEIIEAAVEQFELRVAGNKINTATATISITNDDTVDFVPTAISHIRQGTSLTISATVDINGNTQSSTNARFYYATGDTPPPATINDNFNLIETQNISGREGQRIKLQTSFSPTEAENYHFVVCADVVDFESNPDNNCLVLAPIFFGDTNENLAITEFIIPSIAGLSSEFTARVTIRNLKTTTANDIGVNIYSVDTASTQLTIPVPAGVTTKVSQNIGNLAPNARGTTAFSNIAFAELGTFYFVACTSTECSTPRTINIIDIDTNNSGMIDIATPLQLHNMRYNLVGTSYKTSSVGEVFCKTAEGVDTDCKGYELRADIDLSSYSNWQPIGNIGNPFDATFAGNNYTISNLTINRAGDSTGTALFGGLQASVRDLTLDSPQIIGLNNVAALAGIVVDIGFSISNIKLISAGNSIPDIRAFGGNAGGLIGSVLNMYSKNIILANIHSSLTVGSGDTVGGLVGLMGSNSSITDSGASGSVRGSDNVGGLVGGLSGTISDSRASGSVIGSGAVGGLVGRMNSSSSITDSRASGSVRGSNRVGGLVGGLSGTISDSRASGSVIGSDTVGGLVGLMSSSSSISDSGASGSVSGRDGIGGLVGVLESGSISGSGASGSVRGSRNNVGGLVGFISSGSAIVNTSWASGSVSGTNFFIGGFIGLGGNANNSWASGSVLGNSTVGGFIGNNVYGINNSWASGFVFGSIGTGGFSGRGTIGSNYYWNEETSSQATSVGGAEGVTTQQMLSSTGADTDTAFADYSSVADPSWDFSDNAYPTLRGNFASSDFQAVHQVAGNILLASGSDVTDGSFFLGATNIQDNLSITASSITGTLAIFDTNAAAPNDTARADFFPCVPAAAPTNIGDTLLTTTGVNETNITLQIAAGTTNPIDWQGDDSCNINRIGSGTPTAGDKLNLEAIITKGEETAIRRFKITFIE